MTRRTLAAIGLSLALAPIAAAQDAEEAQKTQTVQVRGLSFEVPASWKVSQPSNQMRLIEIAIPPAEGDEKPGELVLFAFPGGAGTVQANVDRWKAQFVDEQGKNPEVQVETIEAGDAEITLVETSGRYVAQIPRPIDEPGFRLLGGIYPTRQVGYFFKLVGPDKTVAGAREGFSAMLKSIKAGR